MEQRRSDCAQKRGNTGKQRCYGNYSRVYDCTRVFGSWKRRTRSNSIGITRCRTAIEQNTSQKTGVKRRIKSNTQRPQCYINWSRVGRSEERRVGKEINSVLIT